MHIGITGASGFLGREIIRQANAVGHQTVAFSRRPERAVPGAGRTAAFSPGLDLHGIDAVIHLSGESILGFWTAKKKRKILESRIGGTRQVVEAIGRSARKPRVLVSASGLGIYGDRGDEELTEASPIAPTGFLRDVAVAWEREANRARDFEVRVCTLRIAMVLGQGGGALPLMAPVFRAGLGGNLGAGRQWLSWVHVRDVAALFLYAAAESAVDGPVNGTAPRPVRNAEFTATFGRLVHRPTLIPAPVPLLRLLLREESSLVLDSQRALPAKAMESGFKFRYPTLEAALNEALHGK